MGAQQSGTPGVGAGFDNLILNRGKIVQSWIVALVTCIDMRYIREKKFSVKEIWETNIIFKKQTSARTYTYTVVSRNITVTNYNVNDVILHATPCVPRPLWEVGHIGPPPKVHLSVSIPCKKG